MRKTLIVLLVFVFLLSACQLKSEDINDSVTFYYIRSEFEYFSTDGIIASEQRDASGHRNDLAYLMAMYMMGPSEEGLQSPLPKEVILLNAMETDDGVILNLSNHKTMSDASFSLSCACLALTCFDITDAPSVTVTSGDRSITMDRNTISLYDNSLTAEESP